MRRSWYQTAQGRPVPFLIAFSLLQSPLHLEGSGNVLFCFLTPPLRLRLQMCWPAVNKPSSDTLRAGFTSLHINSCKDRSPANYRNLYFDCLIRARKAFQVSSRSHLSKSDKSYHKSQLNGWGSGADWLQRVNNLRCLKQFNYETLRPMKNSENQNFWSEKKTPAMLLPWTQTVKYFIGRNRYFH